MEFTQLAEEDLSDFKELRVDGLQLADRVDNVDVNDFVPLKCSHAAKLAPLNHVDSVDPEPRRQHPIGGRRSPATLDVTENRGSRFEIGSSFDLLGKDVSNTPKMNMAEFVLFEVLDDKASILIDGGFSCKFGALGDNDRVAREVAVDQCRAAPDAQEPTAAEAGG